MKYSIGSLLDEMHQLDLDEDFRRKKYEDASLIRFKALIDMTNDPNNNDVDVMDFGDGISIIRIRK